MSYHPLDLDRSSAGSTSQSRYEYQNYYGALLCLGLIDGPDKAIHCERVDDFAIEHRDGTFDCIQVATKGPDSNPFKATEAKVIKTLKTFCKLEVLHGQFITGYAIVASCGFFVGGARVGLRSLIDHCRETAEETWASDESATFFSVRLNVDAMLLRGVLLKLRAVTAPSVDDIEPFLWQEVTRHPKVGSATQQPLQAIFDSLLDHVRRASTERVRLGNKTYLAATMDPAALHNTKLELKAVRKADVEKIIADGLAMFNKPAAASYRSNRDLQNLSRKLGDALTPQRNVDTLKERTYLSQVSLRVHQLSNPDVALYRDQVLRTRADSIYARVHDSLSGAATRYDGGTLFRALEAAIEREVEAASLPIPRDYTTEEMMGHIGQLANDCNHSWDVRLT